MTKKLILLILLICLSSPLLSQIIDEIQFTGNTLFNDSYLLQSIPINIGDDFKITNIDSSLVVLKKIYNDNGYFFFELDSVVKRLSADSQKISLDFFLAENSPVEIKNIFLKGDSPLNENFYEIFSSLKNSIFNSSRVEEEIFNALDYAQNVGYPFLKLELNSIELFSDSLSVNKCNVFISVFSLRESYIDEIKIEGNVKTDSDVILRELRISPGEKYSQEKIDIAPSRLDRLRFFEPVETPLYYIASNDKGTLLIRVIEKNTNNFDGVLGYVPSDNENTEGYVTGLVNVSLRNLFGTGRAAAFRWRRIDQNSQELELKYLEPWFLGYPLNINLDLFQRQQDTIFVQRKYGGSIDFLLSVNVSIGASVSTENTIPTENESSVFTVFNSSQITTGLNVKIDSRDNLFSPKRGVYFRNAYFFSQKEINGPAQFITADIQTELSLQRYEIDLEFYYQIFSRDQVAFLALNGREIQSSFLEIADLYRLGGFSSLRGYREDQFLANRVLWSNFEYRIIFDETSYGFIFFDSGYYLRSGDSRNNTKEFSDYLYGYGLGITFESPLGILAVNYGLGKEDSFSEGKIHFGIINEF